MGKIVSINGKKVTTFYRIKMIQPGEEVLLFFKETGELLKSVLVSKPKNFKSIFDMDINEYFVFRSDVREHKIGKYNISDESLSERVQGVHGPKQTPVSFFKPYDETEGPKIQKRHREVLDLMSRDIPKSAKQLKSNIGGMLNLVKLGYAVEVETDNNTGLNDRLFLKLID